MIITARQSSRETTPYRVGAAGVGETDDGPEVGTDVFEGGAVGDDAVGGAVVGGGEVGGVAGPLVGVSGPDEVGDSLSGVVGSAASVVVGVVGVVVVGMGRCTSDRGTQV
ncbi:MAG: hypothetical protein WCJ53_11725 [Mycobacteriaceae bacterium]